MKTILASKLGLNLLMFLLISERLVCYGAEPTNQLPSDEALYNEANPQMIWGAKTNFLRGQANGGPLQAVMRSGIDVSNGIIVLSGHPSHVMHPARFCLENCLGPLYFTPTYDHGVAIVPVDPKNMIHTYLPPFNERFDIAMTNATGEPVPKTPLGRNLGKPSSLKPNTPWGPQLMDKYKLFSFTGPKDVLPMSFSDDTQGTPGDDNLDPTKYFKITKNGLYKLTITQRLFIMDTNRNSYVRAIELPPVTVPVRVENDAN